VFYEPGQALQVDWGSCGYVAVGGCDLFSPDNYKGIW
jgi:hypothetical protein